MPNDTVTFDARVIIVCQAEDANGDILTYDWWSSGGSLLDTTGQQVQWQSGSTAGTFEIDVTVADAWDSTTASAIIYVQSGGGSGINQPPVIEEMYVEPESITGSDTAMVYCRASDPEDPLDSLRFTWNVSAGYLLDNSNNRARWVAPVSEGIYSIKVIVSDGRLSTSDSIEVDVKPDTVSLFFSDFSIDEVTDQWEYIGLLAGLGEQLGTFSISWNETALAMEVVGRSNYATYGFRLKDRNFGEGTFRVKIKAPNYQFGRVAFMPKFVDTQNYLIIGVNFYQQSWQVLRCINGRLQYLAEGWDDFLSDTYYGLAYYEKDGVATALIGDIELWRGNTEEVLSQATNIGVGVYGLAVSQSVLYDDLIVTYP
ncbi:MAG: hypothetical protein P9X24_00395 [Candidatus Hatepunaea meridiana]|nr:hypothetical protein [Candidatus Hatepunaea meridiana]